MFRTAKSLISLLTSGLDFGIFCLTRFGYFLLGQLKKINPRALLNQKPDVRNFILGICFCLVFIYGPLKIYEWFKNLPQPDLLLSDGAKKSTRILDRKGRLLYEIYVDKDYQPVELSQIPVDFINATVAVEDRGFYTHLGFQPLSILRAFKETFVDKNVQGGSTITQQLIKNVLLTSERTYTRKLKEIVLAVLVELKYSKDEILQLYLNNISYGGDAVGVDTAAHKFFGRSISQLKLSEIAALAGLPSAPSMYSPLSGDMSRFKERQKYVLDSMVLMRFITQKQADEAYDEGLVFVKQTDFIRAPHFVHFVKDKLVEEYGSRYIETGGLTIETSLDLDIQDEAQKIVAEQVAASRGLNINNGAAVVLDPQTGQILAYVGSVDYFKEGWGAFDVASAKRQPGSSVKPITYSLALTRGYTPATVIEDAPLVVKNAWETYTPVNYDGRYHGNVTVRQALANSYNIPAVKTVIKFGPYNMVDLGNKMGLKEWDINGKYGPSVTLGGMEVSLLDLTNTYGTLAREGVYKDIYPVLSITDAKGFKVYSQSDSTNVSGNENRVLSREVSYLISNILADNQARLPAFGYNSQLVIPNHTVAVKTGTTDKKRDNWTIGYTSKYVVGVWVGNNDNSAMNPLLASGLSGAAPIWNKIMSFVLNGNTKLDNTAQEEFAVPENIVMKTDPECGNIREYFIRGSNIPRNLCKIDSKDAKKDQKRAFLEN